MERTVDVLKVGGRVLLCILTDLARETDLPSAVPCTCEPENDGETVFIRVSCTHCRTAHTWSTLMIKPGRQSHAPAMGKL